MRTVLIYAWIAFSTFFMGVTIFVITLFKNNSHRAHRIARTWADWILFVSGIRVRVHGMVHVDKSRPYIFMSNHQSLYDIPVLLGRLKCQFRWLAKKELFRIPVFSQAMKGAGYISIDRQNRESAFKSLEEAAENIRGGTSVMIFPEGTRSRDGNIKSFKKGGFVLSVDAGVPIVPVIIYGTGDIMPKKTLRIRPIKNVTLEILPPVQTAGYNRASKDDLLNRIHHIMRTAYEKGRVRRTLKV